MAKKVVVPTDEDKKTDDNGVAVKKKRSKCCTCLIVFAIVSIVILAAVFGVGWYFGDKYSKEFFNMTLGDTLGVVGDLYWTDDEDVVSRPYKEKNINGFYKEIKKNILLKEDADIDFKSALQKAVDNYLAKDDADSAQNRNADADSGADAGADESKKDENSIIDIFTDMLSEVFTSENIDVDRLKEYDEANDTYILNVVDTQVAAFADMVLKLVLDNSDKIDALSSVSDIVPLKSVVKLKQVKFIVQSKADEQGVKTKAAAADVVLWLGLQKAAKEAVSKFMNQGGFGWASGIAGFFTDMVLPENVYISLTIPLEDGADANFNLNGMDAESKKRMYKLLDGVFKNIMKESMTVESLLDKNVDTLNPYLKSVETMLDFTKASKGSIGLDLLGAMADKASESLSKDDPLTKPEFMYMLQALLTSSADDRLHDIEPYLYANWYATPDGKKTVYKYDDSVDTTGMQHIDYVKQFIREINDVYSLDFDENGDIKDILSTLGVSLDGSTPSNVDTDAILNKINKQKFNASLAPDKAIKKLRITDRMLAASVAGQMGDLLGENETLAKLNITLDALTFIKEVDDKEVEHTEALLAVKVDLAEMISSMGSDNMLMQFATKILPEKIEMSISVDITLDPPAGFTPLETRFMINDYEKTAGVLDTLKKLVPSFDLNSITGEVSTMLTDMIGALDEKLGIELATADITAVPVVSGALVMPDIYSLVVDTLLTNDDGTEVISNVKLKNVLYELNNVDAFEAYINADGTLKPDVLSPQGFVDEVVDKYYLNPTTPITTFGALTDFLNDDTVEFATKFRVRGDDPRVKYLAYDTDAICDATASRDLTPRMTDSQLAGLISEKLQENASIKDMFEVVAVDTAADEIKITLAIDMATRLPEKVVKLMSAEKLFVTATVDIAHPIIDEVAPENNAYPVKLTINSMTDEEYSDLLTVIGKLGGEFDVASNISEFGKILYTQLNNLTSGLGDGDFMRFTDSGLQLSSFYEFLANALRLERPASVTDDLEWAETIRGVVQGMFEKSTVAGLDGNTNNYALNDFLFNPPTAGLSFDLTSLEWTDKDFNAYFEVLLAENNVHAVQTIALAANDTEGDAGVVREWFVEKTGSSLDVAKNYIIVSFRIEVGEKFDAGADAKGLMPEQIYATVALELNKDDAGKQQFACAATVFNNMTAQEYAILMDLMGMSNDSTDPNKVNIATATDDCLSQANDLTDKGEVIIQANADATTGIGKIKLNPTIPIPLP